MQSSVDTMTVLCDALEQETGFPHEVRELPSGQFLVTPDHALYCIFHRQSALFLKSEEGPEWTSELMEAKRFVWDQGPQYDVASHVVDRLKSSPRGPRDPYSSRVAFAREFLISRLSAFIAYPGALYFRKERRKEAVLAHLRKTANTLLQTLQGQMIETVQYHADLVLSEALRGLEPTWSLHRVALTKEGTLRFTLRTDEDSIDV